jgi:hypothetical protein
MSDLPVARVVRGGAPRVVAPPRRVPRRLVWRLWFGTGVARIAWLVTAIGMLAAYRLLPRIELTPPGYDLHAVGTIEEVVVADGPRRRRQHYVARYSFVDQDGVVRRGEVRSRRRYVVGAHGVSYVSDDPDTSRLEGSGEVPWAPLVPMVIPVVALGFALVQWAVGRRAVRLLRFGVETRGRLVRRESGGFASRRGSPVFQHLVFAYQVADGRTFETFITPLEPALVTDDADEPMLYDPRAPQVATPLDHLPGGPRIGPGGELQARPGLGVTALILPLVSAGLALATVVRMLG